MSEGHNDSMKREQYLLELLELLRDQTISDEQFQELQSLLLNDPTARRMYVNAITLQGNLEWTQDAIDPEESLSGPFCDVDGLPFPLPEISFCTGPDCASSIGNSPLDFGDLNPLDGIAQCESCSPPENTLETPSRLFSLFTFLAQPIPLTITLLCVTLIPMAMLAWSLSQSKPEAPPTCVASGQVVKAVACTWDESQGIGLRVGDLLVNHREYHLTEGVVQLDFASGVKAIIQGPAVFRSKSSMLLELTQGRLSAEVPPEGKNFTVTMAGLEVIDRGTEFGVSVDKSAEVELHVFKGRIDVLANTWERDGEVKPLEIHAGQASCVDRLTGKVEKMPADKSKFIREFSTESGLNLTLVNPSFEEPRVADHPERQETYGNLHAFEFPGWKSSRAFVQKSSSAAYLQQTPYSGVHKGVSSKVQKCIRNAIDGEQMLGMHLRKQAKEVWVYQYIGTIRMGDIGATLTVSADVMARKAIHEKVTPYGSTANAILAFTFDTTPMNPGETVGLTGGEAGVELDAPSKHLVAKLTIKPHMVGKPLAIRLLLQDPDPPANLHFERDHDRDELNYDPVNQYYFDMVEIEAVFPKNL